MSPVAFGRFFLDALEFVCIQGKGIREGCEVLGCRSQGRAGQGQRSVGRGNGRRVCKAPGRACSPEGTEPPHRLRPLLTSRLCLTLPCLQAEIDRLSGIANRVSVAEASAAALAHAAAQAEKHLEGKKAAEKASRVSLRTCFSEASSSLRLFGPFPAPPRKGLFSRFLRSVSCPLLSAHALSAVGAPARVSALAPPPSPDRPITAPRCLRVAVPPFCG